MQVEQHPTDSRIAREQSGPVGPTRYDLVLAAIALALAASGVAGATALPWGVALASGGVVAVAATTYGLFVDPPTVALDERPGERRSSHGGSPKRSERTEDTSE